MKKKKKEHGQGMVEYLIVVALVAIASISIVKLMSHSIRAKFAQVTASLQGRKGSGPKKSAIKRIEEKHWRERDMGNFNTDELTIDSE